MRQVILGHRGMVGSALYRLMPDAVTQEDWADMRDQGDIEILFEEINIHPIDVLYLCAAKVGGIQRNISEPGTMIYDNLMIQANIIEAARLAGVKLIVFLGSSCIYPPDPFCNHEHRGISSDVIRLREEDLLSGPLEETNEAYAVAKIAGIKMLEAYHKQYGMEYLAVMPCNLYGTGDNYDLETSHFLPGMIRRFHEAKLAKAESVTLWGTGTPRRELMHVDDCARIIVDLVKAGARGLLNIGPGLDYRLCDYAAIVDAVVGGHPAGEIFTINWDESKPDGVARKLLDVSKMKSFGTRPQINLVDGIERTYAEYCAIAQPVV